MADAAIVMAGGSGTRLWPASLRDKPKQLLRIGGDSSLFQQAVVRARAVCAHGPIVVVTNQVHVQTMLADLVELQQNDPELSRQLSIIPEPIGRNTAPAIALGMAHLTGLIPADGTVIVLSADHIISPTERFVADSATASAVARGGRLVCFGVRPTAPETGFGYIQTGDPVTSRQAAGPAYEVISFKEKPSREVAEQYLAAGTFLWNAGMFCFSSAEFAEQLAVHAGNVAAPIEEAARCGALRFAANSGSGFALADPAPLAEYYEKVESISIDYALMERSSRVAVVPASFAWSDVGSWDAVAELEGGGRSQGSDTRDRPPVIMVAAERNYVRSEIPVALCGVEDLIVVVENGMALICRRGESQLVRRAVDEIKAIGDDTLL